MIPPTLNGNGVSRAPVRFPRYGVPQADVWLVQSTATGLAIGGRATLAFGDVTLLGTLRPGGTFGGAPSYTVIGGGGGWDRPVGARQYNDANGLPLSRLVTDLAREAGELVYGVPVLEVPDGSVGTSWQRPAGLARAALEDLCPRDAAGLAMWWVDAAGVTHVGPRRATTAAPTTATIPEYDVATGRAVWTLSDDAVAQLLPGATLTVQGLPAPFVVGSAIVRVEADSIAVELYAERGIAELFQALVAALAAFTRWHAGHPFAMAADGTTALPEGTRSADFPSVPALPLWGGVPGMTATLASGAPVLVVWLGGVSGQPVALGYGPGVLPVTVTLAASGAVNVGGAGAQPLALAGALSAWATGVNAALAAAGHPAAALGTVATTIARGV